MSFQYFREVEESTKEEEQMEMEDSLTEGEEASESNLSNELIKSLNSTLGDLEQAEKKLIEMNSQNHTATDSQSSESCYLDFMYEFLADFRLKLQQSCEEFISLESQALALLEERKALQDLSLQISNSPRKTVKPKHDSLATVPSDMEQADKKAESEDGTVSEMKFTLPKVMHQESIPLDTVAVRKDSSFFETNTAVPQKDQDKDTAPVCTNGTLRNNTMDNTSDALTNTEQTIDSGVPSHETPPKATPASTTQDSPCDRKKTPEQVATDEEYDGPSPIGMRRMFGSFSAEPKIPLPCPSPTISVVNSPAFSPSPTSVHIANSLAMKLNNEVSPQDTITAQRSNDSGDSSPSETRPTIPQKQEGKVMVLKFALESDDIESNTPPDTDTNTAQTSDINTPNETPSRDTCSPPSCDKKEVSEHTEETDEYDGPSPIGMRRMFGSFSQEPKIPLPPSSPILSVENSFAFSLALKSDLELSPSETTDAQKTCDSSPSETRLTIPEEDDDQGTVHTHLNAAPEKDNIKGDILLNTQKDIKQPNDKDVCNLTTPPKDLHSSTTMERSPSDKKAVPEHSEVAPEEEYDGPSPIGMRRMFGSFSQEPKISLPPSSPVLSVENSPSFSPISLSLDLELSPSEIIGVQKGSDSSPSEIRLTIVDKDKDKATLSTHTSATLKKDNIKSDIPPNTQKNMKQSTEGGLCGKKEHPEQIVDEKCEEISPRMFGSNYQDSKTSFLPPSPHRRSENSPIMPQLNLDVSPVSVESES
ncbi:hypothetical protein E2C01_005235 [Portunus trituberculatus]|uniref:Uncharacterized protein n=1 Tax=Portunus trituberculatus TaxID=210409 RepID=A0A5B7CW40_PORTR|nr:hypothetical protein [Portunus trituberculatus]